jgi:hypothetical protein
LAKSHAATDAWYGGNSYYDYDTGKYKAGLTTEQTKLAKDFTRMLWRGTENVAFGIKGKYVAAWYCNPSGTTNSNGAGVTASASEPMDTYKANVMKSCLKLQSTVDGLEMYNDCFNKRETKAHNAKRAVHEAKDLTFLPDIARAIQATLNSLPRGEAVTMPAAAQRPAAYRNCGENVFTSTSRTALYTTNAATKAWYAGSAQYDFTTH